MKLYISLLLLSFSLLSCNKDDNNKNENGEMSSNNNLVQLNGNQIVDENQNPLFLQGVAFTNFIWNDSPLPPTTHHSEVDYERVKAMGMNSIRFYMNYKTFEDDSNPFKYKQSGWDWLDENIAWAKKNGIYLILNMHAPQGGYQSQGTGDALWDNSENQNRLAALWKAIAARYKDEVQIAGYGLVNEPVPTKNIGQWTILAQKLIDEIRTVDQNHLLFIERAIYVKDALNNDENLNFPRVTGANIVYEFHGYDPYFYTHQLLAFANLGDGGKYPDEERIEVSNSTWYTGTFNNPKSNSGTTDWTYFEGEKYKITDPNIAFGLPALVGANVGGTVYFDQLVINEFDTNGVFIRTIVEVDLNDVSNWYFWSENNTGAFGVSNSEGHTDNTSLFIKQTTSDSNLSTQQYLFETKPNHYYQISGWMKGDNIAASANCQIRLDFLKSEGPIFKRNKAYLEAEVNKIVAWSKSKNVPLYMGEFGAGNPSFQNGKGGLTFVTDMVSIAKENNIHFTYHAYHETSFGLYLSDDELPDPSKTNQALINLFTTILK